MTINVLNCPSEDDQLATPFGHVSYAASYGATPAGFGLATPDGLFGTVGGTSVRPIPAGYGPDEPIVKLAMVTDGLSNTAAFSERVKGVGNGNNTAYDGRQPSGNSVAVLTPTYPGNNAVQSSNPAQPQLDPALDPGQPGSRPAGMNPTAYYNQLCTASGGPRVMLAGQPIGGSSPPWGPSGTVGGYW